MEKKYCTHCFTLAHEGEHCDCCGKKDFQNIVISVQSSNTAQKAF